MTHVSDTPADRASTSAIVLAGGRSSRMGTPKALLPFGGRPLIGHIVDTLAQVADDIVVVASPGQELPELAMLEIGNRPPALREQAAAICRDHRRPIDARVTLEPRTSHPERRPIVFSVVNQLQQVGNGVQQMHS